MDGQDIFIRFILLGFVVFLFWWVRNMMSKASTSKKNGPKVQSPTPTPSRPVIDML